MHELLSSLTEQELEQLSEEELDEVLDAAIHDEAEFYEKSLADFVKAAWPILEPTTPLRWNWHLDLLCEYLTLCSRGECRRLIINVPPRTMKSLLCTVFYPVWRWASRPDRRFMFVSYAEKLSTDHSVYRRNVMNSPWFRERWGHCFSFAKDQNLKTQYENSKRGAMFSTSITGTATGKGGDELIFDDPQNPETAISDTERATSTRNFDTTFRPRLNDPANGVIIVIMQRLHELDVSGHAMTKEPGEWTHIKLPAEAEYGERWEFPISRRVVERKPTDLLWPERLSRDVLKGLKASLGSWAYAGQYQQNPAPLEGGIIKRAWLKFYRELPAKGSLLQSWDCSFKDTKDSDFVVGQVWQKSEGSFYLVDQVRDRMDFVQTKAAIRAMSAKHAKATAKLIEDKANGPAVIASLRTEISGIIAITPKDSKEARLHAVSPLFEAGNVYLPDPSIAPWVNDYIQELCTFPNAAHDDQVDSTSQALSRFMAQGGGILEYYRTQAGELAERAEKAKVGTSYDPNLTGGK